MPLDRALPFPGAFWGQRLPQGAAQPLPAGLGTRPAPPLRQVVFLRLVRHARGHAVAALPPPPALLLLRQLPAAQLRRPVPLQEAHRNQARLRPPLHLGELPEAVLGKAQRALEFLEEQLDLPAIMPSKME